MAKRFLSNIRINDAYTFPASDGTNNQVIKTDGSGNLSFGQLAADSASVMYKDTFTGDGSTTGFTLSNALNDEVQSNIYIDGVYQSKSTYSVSGTTVTFSTAPLSGHEIEVISTTGINSGPTAIYTDTFTANGSATAFTLGQTVHSENQTIVFLNGVYQFKGTYTLSGTTLTLDAAPSNGVSIEVMSIGSAYSGGDILYDHDFTSAGLMTSNGSGVYSITANNSANWNTAYGWGDHGLSAQDKTDIGNLSGTNTGDQDLSSYATQSYVGTQISNLVDSSPATLNTLNELAAALGDDPNFATTTANSIGLKAPLASPSFTGNATFAGSITTNLSSEGTYFTGGSGGVRQLSITSGTNISAHALHTFNIASSNGKYEFDVNGTTELSLDGSSATFTGTIASNNIAVTNSGNGELSVTRTSGATVKSIAQSARGQIGTSSNHELQLITNATSRLTISTSGNATFAGNISGVRGFFNSGTTNVVATFTSTDGTATLKCADPTGNVEFGASGNNFVVQPAGGVAQLTVNDSITKVSGMLDIIGSRSTYVQNAEDDTATSHIFTTDSLVGDFAQLAGSLVLQARVNDAIYRDIIMAGGLGTTANPVAPILTVKGEGIVQVDGSLTINGGSTFANMITINIDDISTGENRGVRIINTNGVDQQWNITTGITGQENDSFCVRDSTGNVNAFTMAAGTGHAAFSGNVALNDSGQLRLGTSNDVQIYHNNAHFFADNNKGNSYIRNTSTGDIIVRNSAGGDIQFDNEFAGKILFNTSNIQRMSIDSDGNVGIGVTPWASSLPNTVIDLNPTASIWGYSNSIYLNSNAYYNNGWLYKSTAAAGVLQVDGDILRWRTAASGTADAGISFDVAFLIDSAGNVGIGETAPGTLLSLKGAADTSIITLKCTKNDSSWNGERIGGIDFFSEDGSGAIGAGIRGSINYVAASSSGGSTDMTFKTGDNSEKVRITNSGTVGIGDSNPAALANRLSIAASGGTGNVVDISTGSTANNNVGAIVFRNSARNYCGQITVNGATGVTSYLSASDYRLKEDLQDFQGLNLVSNIKVYNYKWKSADERTYGVMAHELQEVLPQAVVGEKDHEEMQSVDYSKIVPLLVKSIQELKADNDSLKARIETLENN